MGSTPVGGSENSFSEYFDLRTLLHYLIFFLSRLFQVTLTKTRDKHKSFLLPRVYKTAALKDTLQNQQQLSRQHKKTCIQIQEYQMNLRLLWSNGTNLTENRLFLLLHPKHHWQPPPLQLWYQLGKAVSIL